MQVIPIEAGKLKERKIDGTKPKVHRAVTKK
jgi:hypothetical protein